MSHAVVIFTRSPEGEARAKGLPARSGVRLFQAILTAWIHAARRAGATPIVAGTAADRAALTSIAGNACWIEQRGDSFGDRLAFAAAEAFALGHTEVLIGGIDTPPHDLARAFDLLETGKTRAVVVPARDGGVNLIGLNAPATDLLRTIRQGQRDLVARFREHFSDLTVLPAQPDLDSIADVAAATRERCWIAFRPLLLGCIAHPESAAAAEIAGGCDAAVSISRAPPRAL